MIQRLRGFSDLLSEQQVTLVRSSDKLLGHGRKRSQRNHDYIPHNAPAPCRIPDPALEKSEDRALDVLHLAGNQDLIKDPAT